MSVVERQEWDVVVVGAGGAGLRAAIEARERGARTAVICKSLFGKAHTVMAEGGIAAAMANANEHDNWQVHFRDTMRGGKFLNQWRMAELHAQEAPDRVWELETWGALFDRTKDGRISQRNFGGHEYPRLAHVGDRTGLELIRTLQQKIVALQQQDEKETGDYESRLKVYQECTVTRILKTESDSGSAAGSRVSGVFAYDRETGRFFVLDAPAVVIATGGIGKSFKVTSNSWEYTGDGHALALLAGAPLLNMEFVQFHPTGMVWPPSVKGILVTESVRGDGGVLRNSEGKRFMFDYIPDVFKEKYAQSEEEGDRWYEDPDNNRRPPELLPRDEVARAINSEVKAGRGSPHGGVFLDVSTRMPAEVIRRRLPPCTTSSRSWRTWTSRRRRWRSGRPATTSWAASRSSRTRRRRVGCRGCSRRVRWPAVCTARTASAATRCPTCWCSAAGRLARRRVLGGAGIRTPRGQRPPGRHGSRGGTASVLGGGADRGADDGRPPENPYTLHQELQQTMNDLVGIIRREAEMEQALEKLADLRLRARRAGVEGHRQFNPGWHLALDLRNMLLVSECVARAALERTESRGGHTREDHPTMDRKWRNINLLCQLADPTGGLAATDPERGQINLLRETTDPVRPDLLALFEKEELVKYLAEEELYQ